MNKRRWLWRVVLCSILLAAGWFGRASIQSSWRALRGWTAAKPQRPQPDSDTYAALRKDLERWRVALAERHRTAATDAERRAVEHDARVVLETALPAMMRCWLGTPWDFNGTADKPGGGRIACGYYVATVIKDAGFRVDRYQLAQQPSGNILRSFLPSRSCKLTIGQPYPEFAAGLGASDRGVYLVGLDRHVGFLVVAPQEFRFIHASGTEPWCVVDEDRDHASALQRSNWRMIGNLTADPAVIRDWLQGRPVEVRRR